MIDLGSTVATPAQIIASIRRLYDFANAHPQKTFLVAGSDQNQPLNGYAHTGMASMYKEAGVIPDNVVFSTSYTKLIFGQ